MKRAKTFRSLIPEALEGDIAFEGPPELEGPSKRFGDREHQILGIARMVGHDRDDESIVVTNMCARQPGMVWIVVRSYGANVAAGGAPTVLAPFATVSSWDASCLPRCTDLALRQLIGT